MQLIAISLLMLLSSPPLDGGVRPCAAGVSAPHSEQEAPRQLLAVRGEVTKVAPQSKGFLTITIKPYKDFAEVTVVARENDVVGMAPARGDHDAGADLLSLLSDDDARDDEHITAAELKAGDLVSVIYDPHVQNRALEIYLH